jgi:Na+/melibiose symporter-like transporter
LIMVGVLMVSGKIRDQKEPGKPILDIFSSILSATGMAMLVFGALQSKTWGWVTPLAKPTIGGHQIAPLGISLVAYLILAGIVVLWLFMDRQKNLEASGKDPLLKASLLKIPALRSGLSVLLSQYFTIAALFFVVPVYLQTILGYDALHTGFKLVPLSIGLLLFSAAGSRLSAIRSAKRIVRWGQLAMSIGVLLVLCSIQPSLSSTLFWIGMFIVGAGFGLLGSQLGNVNMSAVDMRDTAQAGGLQGTYQNLGSSFGTAVVGSVFMLLLTSGFNQAIKNSPGLSAPAKQQIAANSATGIGVISQSQAKTYVINNGGSEQTAGHVAGIYQQSQIDALRDGLFVVFAVSVLALLFSKNLPASAQ